MSLVNDLYSLYKEQLQDSGGDAVAIVLNVLDGQSRKHILQLLEQMNDSEITQMLSLYLIEMLKLRMVQDGTISPFEISDILPMQMH